MIVLVTSVLLTAGVFTFKQLVDEKHKNAELNHDSVDRIMVLAGDVSIALRESNEFYLNLQAVAQSKNMGDIDFSAKTHDELSQRWMSVIHKAYLNNFSDEELASINEFFDSSVGRKLTSFRVNIFRNTQGTEDPNSPEYLYNNQLNKELKILTDKKAEQE